LTPSLRDNILVGNNNASQLERFVKYIIPKKICRTAINAQDKVKTAARLIGGLVNMHTTVESEFLEVKSTHAILWSVSARYVWNNLIFP
jgi:hypothetical protein